MAAPPIMAGPEGVILSVVLDGAGVDNERQSNQEARLAKHRAEVARVRGAAAAAVVPSSDPAAKAAITNFFHEVARERRRVVGREHPAIHRRWAILWTPSPPFATGDRR